MTYQEALPAFRRTFTLGKPTDTALLRIAAALALFAVLSALVMLSEPAQTPLAPGLDWHGNVAASGYAK